MGMDVYGISPTTEEGAYFRRSVWGWHPLADLVQAAAPELTARCKYWHSNDGDGLPPSKCAVLAAALEEKMQNGWVQSYVAARDAEIAEQPNVPCQWCNGTGVRRDEVGVRMGQPDKIVEEDGEGLANARVGQKGWCNGCHGRGWNPPTEASYHVDPDDVAEFITFLKGCGGFQIC